MNLNHEIKNYRNLQNNLAILKLVLHSIEQVKEGKVTEQKDVFLQIENKFFS